MKGYVVANLTVTDAAGFAEYGAKVADVVARYDGRYLIRAGAIHPREGDLGLDRFVVLEFPSMEAAELFYSSAEYAPLLALREATTRSQVAIVEGYEPA